MPRGNERPQDWAGMAQRWFEDDLRVKRAQENTNAQLWALQARESGIQYSSSDAETLGEWGIKP